MKSKIDQTKPVELTLSTPQLPTFTISGSYIDVAPIYDKVRTRIRKTQRMSTIRQQTAATLTAITSPLVERVATYAKASVYDRRNGTHFVRALRDKRQLEKDLAMAQSLGLLNVDVCAKHRKALQTVKSAR